MRSKLDWGRYRLLMFVLAVTAMLALGAALRSTHAQEPATTTAPATTEAAPATPPPPAPDSTGANAGGVADVTAADAKAGPTVAEVADRAGKNKISINIVWTLITGFIVMFMQAGFALVETGLCRAKNSSHTMAMNFMIYPLGMLGFYLCGFAFMFGGVGTIAALGPGTGVLDHMFSFQLAGKTIDVLGMKGFCLGPSVFDVSVFTLFLFQMVFMDTTATIPTGTMAERWKFSSFVLYGLCLGTIMYPIYGNWVWGGGWLADLGANFGLGHGVVDFAGSSVVHMQGGVIAAVGGWFIGPRLGKYNKDGSINPIAPHSIPMVMLGTFILAFGWFGFNPGSTLAGTDGRIAIVAVNTMMAGTTAALGTYFWMIGPRKMKPDPSMLCNGMLAGLVAITAPCAFVQSWAACVIGLIAGIVVVEAVFFFDRVAKIDDCVGAISVHGVCGAFGLIAVGLFSDGSYGSGWNGVGATDYLGTAGKGVTGIFYGDSSQLVAQCIGALTCLIWNVVISLIVFKGIDMINGTRISPEVELAGADLHEMGVAGYSGFVMDKAAETPMSH